MKLLPSAPGYLNRNAEIPTIADYLDLSVLLFFFTPPRYLHQNACHPPGNNMQILAVRERFVPGKLDLALFECAICKCRTMENLARGNGCTEVSRLCHAIYFRHHNYGEVTLLYLALKTVSTHGISFQSFCAFFRSSSPNHLTAKPNRRFFSFIIPFL